MSKYIKIKVIYVFLFLILVCIVFCMVEPKKTDTIEFMQVNVETRSVCQPYSQLGILTCKKEIILPLMGRQLMLNKWQYYAISNTATINTKLPITFSGKNCLSEYGCNQLNNGDLVKVEGYQDIFQVTLYENEKFQYIPY